MYRLNRRYSTAVATNPLTVTYLYLFNPALALFSGGWSSNLVDPMIDASVGGQRAGTGVCGMMAHPARIMVTWMSWLYRIIMFLY